MSIDWGARIDGEVYGPGGDAPWDDTTWNTFEAHTKKKVTHVHWGQPFGAMDLNARRRAQVRGAIPMVDIGGSQTMSAVAAGNYDSWIESSAMTLKTFDSRVMLRPWWEMNGLWYGWGRDPDYASAFARYSKLTKAIAPKAELVWCVNTIWDKPSGELGRWYPGHDHVDWVGIDGYNRNEPWRWPAEVFDSTLHALTALVGTQPFVICETGCTEKGVDKARWITAFLKNWLPKHRRVQMLSWFNWNDWKNSTERWDWQIESSGAAQTAFAKSIASSYYR